MDIERYTEEFVRHQDHAAMLSKTIAEMKKTLTEVVEVEGEYDDKGHQWLPAGRFLLQRQRRQGKKSLNMEKVEEWAKGRGAWAEVSRTIEVIDEDALFAYMFDHRGEEGLEEEFEQLYDEAPVTYAFMKPVEEKSYDY